MFVYLVFLTCSVICKIFWLLKEQKLLKWGSTHEVQRISQMGVHRHAVMHEGAEVGFAASFSAKHQILQQGGQVYCTIKFTQGEEPCTEGVLLRGVRQ